MSRRQKTIIKADSGGRLADMEERGQFNVILSINSEIDRFLVGENPPKNIYERLFRKWYAKRLRKKLIKTISIYKVDKVLDIDEILRYCYNTHFPNGEFKNIKLIKLSQDTKCITACIIITDTEDKDKIEKFIVSITRDNQFMNIDYTLEGKDNKSSGIHTEYKVTLDNSGKKDYLIKDHMILTLIDTMEKLGKDLLIENIERSERIEI